MASDIYDFVRRFISCIHNQGTHYKHQKHLRLFPASGPLEFVAIDIRGRLPKTKKGNLFVVMATDRFSKLTRAVPVTQNHGAAHGQVLLDCLVTPYGIPSYQLTDIGLQFVAKLFESVRVFLGVKQLTTTAYHPKINGQSECYNKTIVVRLSHYVA